MQKNHFSNYQNKPNILLTLFNFIFSFYKFIYQNLRKVLPKSVIIGGFAIFVLVFGLISVGARKSENPKNAVLGITSSENSEAPKFANSESQSSSNSSLENSSQSLSQSLSLESSSQKAESQNNSSLEIKKESEKAVVPLVSPQIENKADKKFYDVLDVVDGDTIKISEIGTLRLIGLDTPETKDPRKVVQCFGVEASNRAKELLSGKKVSLEYDPANKTDKYKRTLAYIYLENGYFYNLEMVKDGFAHSYKSFPHPKLEEFNQAEESAKNQGKGFWSNETCSGNTTQAGNPKNPVAKTPAVQVAKPVETPKPVEQIQTAKPAVGGFIAGSCKSLNAQGLGNFRVGDPNYSSTRDRNGDGVACEF